MVERVYLCHTGFVLDVYDIDHLIYRVEMDVVVLVASPSYYYLLLLLLLMMMMMMMMMLLVLCSLFVLD